MFTMACNIVIGRYRFRRVHAVEIRLSRYRLIGKAVIRLPHLRDQLARAFEEGDEVSIRLGYKGVYDGEEFTGYVRRIHPNIPFEVECEDHGYFLRQTNIAHTWKGKTSLREVVQYIVDQTNDEHAAARLELHPLIPDLPFMKFRIADVTGAQALVHLADRYGLVAYFRGRQLYVGLPYRENLGTVRYSMRWNVISSRLTYRRSEAVALRVKAIAIFPDGRKIEETVGGDSGELRTLVFYNITERARLRELAEAHLQKDKFDGFEGHLRTFLVPAARHGQVAEVKDPAYDGGRAGNYMIDAVTTIFSVNEGAKRIVEIGRKV